MQQGVATTAARDVDIVPGKDLEDFVTFFINDQMFGLPVLKVQDILTPDRIAPIPLAPPDVRGSINLRGRIVTVVDVRVRLGLDKRVPEKAAPAAKESRRPEEVSPPPADKSAHPAQEESPDEASRPAEQGNGAADRAGAPVDTNGAAGPADDENRPAEGASPPPADGSGPADKNAHPAQEESPDEASRPAEQGNGAADRAGAPVDTDAAAGAADAVERPADDENRSAEGASPTEDEDTDVADAHGEAHGMCVTVEHENELYTLLVDRVGDVISLSDDFFEDNPGTLDVVWREFALGVYRLESALMVMLDVGRLLDIKSARD